MADKLIFAPLIRVSTETQEKQGQSLRTQREQLTLAIESLGGEVFKWYEGQEHSTPDYERKILEELMVDAQAGKFNAVIVADLSRWSRDNGRSKQDTRTLQDLGVRFFEGAREINLFDPTQAFVLGMGVEVAEFFASQQSYKSVINRINRAKQGFPVCTLPYGRTFDKVTRTWGIDPKCRERVQQVAALYLEGGSWRELGKMFGMNPASLCLTMNHRCGDTWEQHFKSKRHGINVVIPTKVPRLLPESVILAIREKSADRATWDKKTQATEYLFSRIIFDAETGHALSGTCNSRGVRYYKPFHGEAHKFTINAEILEKTILGELFEVLSSRKSLREAVFSGNPIGAVAERLQGELNLKREEFARVEANFENILTAIENAEDITSLMDRVKPKMKALEERSNKLKDEIGVLEARLDSLPSDTEIEASRGKWAGLLEAVQESHLSSGLPLENLPFEERKKIIRLIFGGKDETGRRYGIYISHLGGSPKKYRFECYGRIGSLTGSMRARSGVAVADADSKMLTGDNPALSVHIAKVIEDERLCLASSRPTPPPA